MAEPFVCTHLSWAAMNVQRAQLDFSGTAWMNLLVSRGRLHRHGGTRLSIFSRTRVLALIDGYMLQTNSDSKPPKLWWLNGPTEPGSRQDASIKACGAFCALFLTSKFSKERWFHGRPAGKSRTASWSQRSVRNLRKAALPSGYRPAGARFEARACKMRDVQLAYDDVAHGVMVLSMSILLSNHREMDTLILMAELPRVTQRWSNYRNDWTV